MISVESECLSGVCETGYGWYVLHTKSRQEKALASFLEAMSIAHYLPLVRRIRHHGLRKAVVEAPLFPSYLFLFGTLDQLYEADRTKRVAHTILVSDQRHLEWEIKNIRMALSSGAMLQPYPYIEKKIRVEVRSGPFRGLQGLVLDKKKNDRLILQVDAFGQAVSLEIDGSLLEPID